jgi:hypothetical protein
MRSNGYLCQETIWVGGEVDMPFEICNRHGRGMTLGSLCMIRIPEKGAGGIWCE